MIETKSIHEDTEGYLVYGCSELLGTCGLIYLVLYCPSGQGLWIMTEILATSLLVLSDCFGVLAQIILHFKY